MPKKTLYHLLLQAHHNLRFRLVLWCILLSRYIVIMDVGLYTSLFVRISLLLHFKALLRFLINELLFLFNFLYQVYVTIEYKSCVVSCK